MSFSPTPPADGFEPWEEEAARAAVRSFQRARGHRLDERAQEDLVQECLLQWWLQRDRYDAVRGANRRTFMNRVCENRLRDLRRAGGTAKRRGPQSDLSLDRDDGQLLQDSIPDSGAVDPQMSAEHSALRDLIANVRPGLSARQQALVDALLDDLNVGDSSKRLGVPRSTLHDELRRMQQAFRDAGLEDFLR